MAEFDFDELDKAVNDLMANVSNKRNTALDDPEEKVVTLTESDTQANVTTPATPINTPVTADPVAAATAPVTAPASLATKRRGQFMDIMGPSAPQQKVTPVASTPARVSRQGATIQPVLPTTSPTAKAGADIVPAAKPAPTPAVETPVAPAPVSESEAVVESTEISEPEVITEPAPLATPFLTDAKVEKRPLGGNSASVDATDNSATIDVAEGANQMPSEPAPAVDLPAELSGDVLAVESNDLTHHADMGVQNNIMTDIPQATLDVAQSDEPSAASEPSPTTEATPEQAPEQALTPDSDAASQPDSAARASIMQQYTEQPSTGDQSNGSIYDTATYHQAIQPGDTAKKHSPVKWIILIIILLVVGAAGGAAAFYFTR